MDESVEIVDDALVEAAFSVPSKQTPSSNPKGDLSLICGERRIDALEQLQENEAVANVMEKAWQ